MALESPLHSKRENMMNLKIALAKEFPNQAFFKKAEILDASLMHGISQYYMLQDMKKYLHKVQHGMYIFKEDVSNTSKEDVSNTSTVSASAPEPQMSEIAESVQASIQMVGITNAWTHAHQDVVVPFKEPRAHAHAQQHFNQQMNNTNNYKSFVPEKDPCYVTWGNFSDLEKIIASKMFMPVFISGLSGNGKSLMVEQACAKLKRPYVRVQVTPETDESDLIGKYTLIDGNTVFEYGPVIHAMRTTNCILLIDEIDRGNNKLLALQGILEGKSYLVKKTGELISPAPGFNIIATGNTKGRGSDSGHFTAATLIDEAFLERFTITMDQGYPSPAIEKKIILKHMEKYNIMDEDFAEKLTQWSDAIRKTFIDGGINEIISTRRICHIAATYAVFGSRIKSVKYCTNRFDEDTIEAFVSLYTSIDPNNEKSYEEMMQQQQQQQQESDAETLSSIIEKAIMNNSSNID
jgi:hypothetical protein